MISTPKFTICDVCRLLDYCTDEKPCMFCSLCDAWICSEDSGKWGRRILAAAKRKLEHGYRGVPNYEEIAMGNKQQ